jgi:hypothetical protein
MYTASVRRRRRRRRRRRIKRSLNDALMFY